MSNFKQKQALIKPSSKPGGPATLKFEQQDNIMPSPDVLERLEPMAPGVTKKMLEWAESEQKHRQLMDRMVVKRSITLEYFRLSLAFFAVLTVFGTGVYFMTNGHETCGTTIITTTAVALVVAFVSARKKDAEQERGQ